jgi:hypothetical protein
MKPPPFLNRWPDADDFACVAVVIVCILIVGAVLLGLCGGLGWMHETFKEIR